VSKAKLTITGDGPEPRILDIKSDTIIGRSARADLQIEGDLVSRQHAKISFSDGAWRFEDLGSRNGSLLNGQRATTAVLKSGDVISIGYGKIVFEDLTSAASSVFAVSIIESEADFAGATVADVEDDNTGATVALTYRDLVLVNQRMNTIARISQQLATILDRDELLNEVLETLFSLFDQCDRAAVVLRDDVGAFQVVATQQRGQTTATMSVMRISTSLIQFVKREAKAVLSADTAQDDRFSGRESIIGVGGRSIMCAPLLAKDDFLGVIYLDTESLQRPFLHADLNLLQGIAGPMAIFLKNSELVTEIEVETTMRTSLSRYLSPDIVREIGDGGLTAELGGSKVTGTIMFSDIVGFTAMSEKLAPAEVVERLNRYFTSMLEAIFGWEGTVDKFGGDAVLAVWGAPVANEFHAPMAVAAALEMQVRLFELNCALEEAGETRIRMAVGLNSGSFVAGNIGGQDRIEWTVIGDAVNLAQRVESKGFPRCILVSGTTYADIDGSAGAYEFPPVQVKNRTEPVRIFSIRTLRTERGIMAALPVQLTWEGGESRGMVAKVHTKERTRLTIRTAGSPPVGAEVTIACDLPERPGSMEVKGTIAGSAPLLLSKEGRAVDVDVNEADAELTRLFETASAVAAPMEIDEIDRTYV
jgi:adenylate cyclase